MKSQYKYSSIGSADSDGCVFDVAFEVFCLWRTVWWAGVRGCADRTVELLNNFASE